jgi:4-hydroxybenzoate polyprenyltransferase
MRPIQWVKNLFVLAPLVFSKQLGDHSLATTALLTMGLFCLVSSAVYILNDIVDRHLDAAHPTKCKRPIASGALSVPVARGVTGGLAVSSVFIGAYISPMVSLLLTAYVLLNVLYTFVLKRIPYVDVGCIALGFLLRVATGGFAIDVHLSLWLMVCTFLLAFLLGLGKRKHELESVAQSSPATTRLVLAYYRSHHIDWVLRGLGVVTILCYAAYTLSAPTIQQFGTWHLVFTLPFVVMGLWRYIVLVSRVSDAQSPTDTMVRDPLFLVNMGAWVVVVGTIVYWNSLSSMLG